MDEAGSYRPDPDTRKVNLEKLITILKSEEPADMEGENAWMFDGKRRMLDGANLTNKGLKIGLDCFPRSGGMLVRTYMDQITGVETGSNMPLEMTTH